MFNMCIDLFFLADIVITFLTTYIDDVTGDEIAIPKKIAINYLKGWFTIDLLATIPFDLFVPDGGAWKIFSLFGLLKILRISRLGRLINYLKIKDTIKITLKIFKLVSVIYMQLGMLLDLLHWLQPHLNKDDTWLVMPLV